MGVYHLMGLGLSPGAVIGPLSYLGNRYQRWNEKDRDFFSRSGELIQREANKKVGDVQALVFFTTKEIRLGEKPSYGFVDNSYGRIQDNPQKKGGKMKETLGDLLRRELPQISGGKKEISVFWCDINRSKLEITYDRIVQVIAALAGAGGQGKEMWANLTGGSNTVNFALDLAATLSGDVARLYYVQAADQRAEKCVRCSSEKEYWIDLPVMPLSLDEIGKAAIDLLEAHQPLKLEEIYELLVGNYWATLGQISSEQFRNLYLARLWTQGLIAEKKDEQPDEDQKKPQNPTYSYIIGREWKTIQPYLKILDDAKKRGLTIEQLSKDEKESWIEHQTIKLDS